MWWLGTKAGLASIHFRSRRTVVMRPVNGQSDRPTDAALIAFRVHSESAGSIALISAYVRQMRSCGCMASVNV